jgi:hypothetical protein
VFLKLKIGFSGAAVQPGPTTPVEVPEPADDPVEVPPEEELLGSFARHLSYLTIAWKPLLEKDKR